MPDLAMIWLNGDNPLTIDRADSIIRNAVFARSIGWTAKLFTDAVDEMTSIFDGFPLMIEDATPYMESAHATFPAVASIHFEHIGQLTCLLRFWLCSKLPMVLYCDTDVQVLSVDFTHDDPGGLPAFSHYVVRGTFKPSFTENHDIFESSLPVPRVIWNNGNTQWFAEFLEEWVEQDLILGNWPRMATQFTKAHRRIQDSDYLSSDLGRYPHA